jgi:3-deoxy-D-manno-octulosonate 8-phosphate phosphatase (KDO 8-P phosphatase)
MSGPTIRPGAREKAARVTLLLLDVDGVLTDGRIVYDTEGRETKAFYVRDGHGIKMLREAGVEVGIVTGRRSVVVEIRARELGIGLVHQGIADKVALWRTICDERGLAPEATAYVGDDIQDVPLLRNVGFAAAVADAEPCVLEAAHYIAGRPGGFGAVRDIAEFILHARGAWDAVTSEYLSANTNEQRGRTA